MNRYKQIENIDDKEALRKATMLKDQLDTKDKIKDRAKKVKRRPTKRWSI